MVRVLRQTLSCIEIDNLASRVAIASNGECIHSLFTSTDMQRALKGSLSNLVKRSLIYHSWDYRLLNPYLHIWKQKKSNTRIAEGEGRGGSDPITPSPYISH